jgi:hypothetical protein
VNFIACLFLPRIAAHLPRLTHSVFCILIVLAAAVNDETPTARRDSMAVGS